MSRFIHKIKLFLVKTSSIRYIKYLRSKGVIIGKNFSIRGDVKSIHIDLTRPSLIKIGANVTVNSNFTLMTHDFVSGVFLNKYSDFLPSSGKVIIGDNVRFGINCTVLKNVKIGNNCFIAAGSIVTKDLPNDCIAGGVPAKIICPLDEFYEKRKVLSVKEAYVYANSIRERFCREPIPADFWEEFPLFIDKSNISYYPEIPIRSQLGLHYDDWLNSHEALFKSFEDFLEAAKNYKE